MYLRRDCAAGVVFLASVQEGRGVKPSARAVGVGKETGYRWLREAFVELRAQGWSVEAAQAELGCWSPLMLESDRQRIDRPGGGRHHLRVDEQVEQAFWRCFLAGDTLDAARRVAGVSRSTAYRWCQARFVKLRDDGLSVRAAAGQLRVPRGRARGWEDERRQARERARRARESAERQAARAAVRESARRAHLVTQGRSLRVDVQARDTRYWQLMRSGLTNTAACTILGVTRRTGGRIRARYRQQTAPPSRPVTPSGRYLSLRERLQIADLLRLNYPMRRIAVELGRSPSTIKRELDRHRDEQGRYLPQSADHTARVQRRRPRQHKLIASPALRTLVQRKLNRCWSPDEISGWLRRTYPHDTSMWLCPETIYRALLVPGGKGLHKRYCRRLRTGRRIRKSRWLTRSGHGATVQNKTMIDKRPAEVETREQAGHWESQCCCQAAGVSAVGRGSR
jgi:transposase, IS30 family